MQTFTTTASSSVLDVESRNLLALDDSVGGGSIVASALAYSTDPTTHFLHSATPVDLPDGRRCSDLSLHDLDQATQSWSAWYLDRGVRPRDRVAVFIADSFAYSIHFYALAQIGAIAVLINSNASAQVAGSLLEQTEPVGLYADPEHLARLAEVPGSLWVVTSEQVRAPAPATLADEHRYKHVGEDPVVILHSSGTTGRPKPTIHTHASIVAGPKFRLVDHREDPHATTMTALPQSHLGCIAFTTYSVLAGAPLVALRDCPAPCWPNRSTGTVRPR